MNDLKPHLFWRKVKRSPQCWEWQGGKTPDGYGRVRRNGIVLRAHRIAWELTYGLIVDSLHVLHTCDNPACVNPDHLFLGTQTDNNTDRHTKGRSSAASGEQNGNARLTLEKVEFIRQTQKQGLSYSQLAERFQVSKSTIAKIIRKETWKTRDKQFSGLQKGQHGL